MLHLFHFAQQRWGASPAPGTVVRQQSSLTTNTCGSTANAMQPATWRMHSQPQTHGETPVNVGQIARVRDNKCIFSSKLLLKILQQGRVLRGLVNVLRLRAETNALSRPQLLNESVFFLVDFLRASSIGSPPKRRNFSKAGWFSKFVAPCPAAGVPALAVPRFATSVGAHLLEMRLLMPATASFSGVSNFEEDDAARDEDVLGVDSGLNKNWPQGGVEHKVDVEEEGTAVT